MNKWKKLYSENTNMSEIEFLRNPPKELYGSFMVKGNQKIGIFKLEFNRNSNKFDYLYYTLNNKKGKGGLTVRSAYQLVKSPTTYSGLSPDKSYLDQWI